MQGKRKIFFNTIKIAGAAIIAILLAQAVHAEFSVSAGIVSMLTIQPTKKETVQTAFGRLVAFFAALVIAYLSFLIFGYHMAAFFVYLILFILVCQIFGWYHAICMNSVLISHFLTVGNMSTAAVKNEILLFCIGVGVGIAVNLHLHKNVDYIEQLKEETDEQIKKILERMSERILNHDMSDYNGECFLKLRNSIRNAKNVAEENFKNQFSSYDIFDIEYIRMRDRQCQVLYEMYKTVRTLDTTVHTAGKISEFLKEMAQVYHRNNTGEEILQKFILLDQDMKKTPLPVERKEFETRAKLYGLLRYMEEFIQIKIEFAQKQEGLKEG